MLTNDKWACIIIAARPRHFGGKTEDLQREHDHWRFKMQAVQRQMTHRMAPQLGPAAGEKNPPGQALAQAGTAAGGAVGVVPGGGGAAPAPPAPRPRRRRELKATFDGDPENLPYFLVQVGPYMCLMEDEYANDAERVNDTRALLEGEVEACCLQNWPKRIFIHMFKDSLDPEVVSRDPDTLMGWICLAGNAEAHSEIGPMSQAAQGTKPLPTQSEECQYQSPRTPGRPSMPAAGSLGFGCTAEKRGV
uniref:Uncharacterized protein n=1 Tax=Sphaerodactylus townsendi TaxID=933632 RepID=A0ACB8FZV5_9SAUR